MTPRCEPELLAALAADLGAGQYTVDGVAAALGPTASAALGREQPLPAIRATEDATDPAAVLTRLWVLGRPVDRDLVAAALPRTGVDGAAALALLTDEPRVRPLVDLRPYAADDAANITRFTPAARAASSTFSVPVAFTSQYRRGSATDPGTDPSAASWNTYVHPFVHRSTTA